MKVKMNQLQIEIFASSLLENLDFIRLYAQAHPKEFAEFCKKIENEPVERSGKKQIELQVWHDKKGILNED